MRRDASSEKSSLVVVKFTRGTSALHMILLSRNALTLHATSKKEHYYYTLPVSMIL